MSARALRNTLLVLSAIGVALAGYLTYLHYSGGVVPCSIHGNPCNAVQKSIYSKVVGVPVALIGLIGYIVILISLLVRETETTRFATAALTVGGFGFSVYLTAREVFTLEKICEWCVGSAILMTVMMCLAVWRFLRGGGPVRQQTPDAGEPAMPEPPAGVEGERDAAAQLGAS